MKKSPILVFLVLVGYLTLNILNDKGLIDVDFLKESTATPLTAKQTVNGNIEVYFIDVGQADSILIRQQDKNMLIDAGNNEDGKKLATYISSLGVQKLDYVFGTHAHEDHIGGMDDIIENFTIDHFYMPESTQTTRTYEEILDALSAKGYSYETPKEDEIFDLADASFQIVHIDKEGKEVNDSSIVILLQYKTLRFLFMGDASSDVENKILNKDIKADVLKVGHHGSEYSSSEAFLDKVNPKYAVIEVGKNNTYGHPKDIILDRLNARNIEIFRTDLDGTIKATSDGDTVTFEKLVTDTNG